MISCFQLSVPREQELVTYKVHVNLTPERMSLSALDKSI